MYSLNHGAVICVAKQLVRAEFQSNSSTNHSSTDSIFSLHVPKMQVNEKMASALLRCGDILYHMLGRFATVKEAMDSLWDWEYVEICSLFWSITLSLC